MVAPAELLRTPAIPKNIPLDIIFYLFWSSATLEDKISYMNVVYSLTIAQ